MIIKEITEYTDKIGKLYEKVGWTNYTENIDKLKNGIRNSLLTLGAFDGEKLLGIIRIVGDKYTIIYIQDILVDPSY